MTNSFKPSQTGTNQVSGENPNHGTKTGTDPASPAMEIVCVRLFDRDYRIRSDQPLLIQRLNEIVMAQVNFIKSNSPEGLAELDIMVQASFRLALTIYQFQKENESLTNFTKTVDQTTENILAAIGLNLEETH
jgi:hypothetical protein